MSDHQRSIRVGAAAIACAVITRLASSPLPPSPLSGSSRSDISETVPYEETGPDVRSSYSLEVFSPEYPAESARPLLPETAAPPADVLPFFSTLPQLNNTTSRDPDLQSLLEQPLSWDLADGDAAVLILSTHTSESYTKSGESYREDGAWRTLDEGYNMLSIGDRVEALLVEAGITVIRDRQIHDYPSYNGSYANARVSIEALMEANPGVHLVLDLHRDAADAPGGGQMATAIDGCARLMLVMGAGFAGYEKNLALALKLTAQLERQKPGITRPIQLRTATFNQDLCPGALLIEVGAAGDTHPQALKAAEELALAIITLAKGTGADVNS